MTKLQEAVEHLLDTFKALYRIAAMPNAKREARRIADQLKLDNDDRDHLIDIIELFVDNCPGLMLMEFGVTEGDEHFEIHSTWAGQGVTTMAVLQVQAHTDTLVLHSKRVQPRHP